MAKRLAIRSLVIPIFFEMFLRYLSLMINTYMVSIHNNDLVGSMGVGNLLLDLFITIFSFLSVGCSVVVAQALGAREFNLANNAMHQSLFLNSMLGLVCGAIMFFYGDVLLSLTNTPSEQFEQALAYVKMLGICLVFDALGIVFASIVRVYNMAYFVTFASLIMNIVSISINYYTLNHTNLDLWGVGFSTIIGRIVGMIILLFALFFKLKLKINLSLLFRFQKDIVKKILNIGGYSAGEQLVWIVQYAIAFSFVNLLGKDNSSVQTTYFQITMLIMLTGQAISMANEIIIGKLIGAKYLDIAYKHTWRILYFSVIATFIVVLIVYFAKDWIMSELELNKVLREIMLPLFGLSILLEVGRTFNIVMVNALRATGDAKFPFLAGVAFMLGISLPVGYVLCFYFEMGILGVWIGFCADEWIRGVANAWRWKSRKWQDKAVV